MLFLFQLELLNDHLFGKELFIRFTVHVFCESLTICVYALDLRVGCVI